MGRATGSFLVFALTRWQDLHVFWIRKAEAGYLAEIDTFSSSGIHYAVSRLCRTIPDSVSGGDQKLKQFSLIETSRKGYYAPNRRKHRKVPMDVFDRKRIGRVFTMAFAQALRW